MMHTLHIFSLPDSASRYQKECFSKLSKSPQVQSLARQALAKILTCALVEVGVVIFS